MLKKLGLLFLLALAAGWASAQTTSVTATVTDSDGQTWNNGTWSLIFKPNPAYPSPEQYYINGVKITSPTYSSYLNQSGALSNAGAMSATVLDNTTITPAGSSWEFKACPMATSLCAVGTTGISGASVNLSSFISNLAFAPRFKAVLGTYGYSDVEAQVQLAPGSFYYNVSTGCLRTYNSNTSTWSCIGGSGALSNPPQFSVQFADTSAGLLTSDSLITGDKVNHALSMPNLGVSTSQSLGTTCAGYYSSSSLPPAGCHSFNYNPMEPYGGAAGNEFNFLVLSTNETTAASTTTYNGFGGLEVYYKASKGGAYTFNGSTGTKTNYEPIQINAEHRTVGQKYGINNNIYSFAGGDTLPIFTSLNQFGGFLENGDEQSVGEEFLAYGGNNSTDSLGGTGEGTIVGISGNTVTYTSIINENTFGEARFIRDLGSKYSTGTYSNVVCSGTAPTTCTVTGSGTTWTSIPGFVGTHTTWNSLSTGGPLLTNNLVFCAAPAANAGYDSCVPITQGINDTSFTMNLYATGSSMNTSWPWATSGSYAIYRSAYPTQVDIINHTFVASDVTGLTSGHNFDQVLAYNPQFIAKRVGFFPVLGYPNRGEVETAFNYATNPLLKMNFGWGLDGPFHAMFTIGQEGMTIQPDFLFQSAYDFNTGVFSFNNLTVNTLQFLDYADSANNFYNAMKVYRNAADTHQGISFFDKILIHPTRGVEGLPTTPFVVSGGEGATDDFQVKNAAQTTVNLDVDDNGNVTSHAAFQNQAGGFGQYQNQVLDSQFQSGSTYWVTTSCNTPNPPTLVYNTTDVTDPFGAHTALKLTSQAVPATGCGSFANQLNQVLSLTSGHSYTINFAGRGAVGGETVAYGFGTTPYSTQSLMTTAWVTYTFTTTISGAVSPGALFLFTPSETVYLDNIQICDNTIGGCLYINTSTSAIAPALGFVSRGVIVGSASLTNPMTTIGDMIVGSAGGVPARLAAGTLNYCLLSNGPGTIPSWQICPSAAGITQLTGDINAGPGSGSVVATLPNVNANTGACGDATHVCQATFNAKGQTTAAAPVAIAFPSGIANIQISIGSFAIPANTCYGSTGSTTPATATMTGLATSSVPFASFSGNPSAITGWGTTGGLSLEMWPTLNTLNYLVCNATAASITGGAITFNVGAR